MLITLSPIADIKSMSNYTSIYLTRVQYNSKNYKLPVFETKHNVTSELLIKEYYVSVTSS